MMEVMQETITNDKPEVKPTPKPSKAKFDAKAYHRRYYHEKLRGEKHCQYCDKLLGSVQSIRKHESRNLLCKIKRLEDEIKNKPYKDVISDAS